MSTEQKYVGRGNHATLHTPAAKNGQNPPVSAEEWKCIDSIGFPYQVSSLGRVRKAGTGFFYRSRPRTSQTGLFISIAKGGRKYTLSVHRLVAQAFVPNPGKHYRIRFKDGNALNPAASNLEWATKAEEAPTVHLPYVERVLNRLLGEGKLTTDERSHAETVQALDDCMSPLIKPATNLIVVPVRREDYATLVGKVVAVVVKAKRFAYYLGRVVRIDDGSVWVSRDNSQWPDRIESRSVVSSIARVVSVLEVGVN